MRTLAVALALVSLSLPAGAATVKKKVAVLELVNPAGLPEQEAAYLTNAVRAEAVITLPAAEFQVMTRENILDYLPPGTDLSKCEGACEVETGRKVGADYVITGDIIRFGSKLKVALRMHNTETSESMAAAEASGADVNAIELPVKAAARRLLKKLWVPRGAAPSAKVEVQQFAAPEDDGSRIKNPPRDEKGYLFVKSNPPGARIFVNGEERGVTPRQMELMVGEYVIVCQPSNKLYATASKRVTMTTKTLKLTMTLPATFGNLRVESQPPGAEILLGGEPTGKTTPAVFKRKPGGKYPVTLRRNLYKEARETVTLGGGKDSVVSLTLAPDFGVLEVRSTPPGAEITLNGEPTGEKTPHTFPARKAGVVEVTVAQPPLYLPQSQRVRLADGKTALVDLALGANFGSLSVTSSPPGLSVELDGRALGETPVRLPRLTTGVHEVKLVSRTHGAPPQRVSIEQGDDADVHFDAQPRLGRLNLTAVIEDGEDREPAEAEVWIDGARVPDTTPFKKELIVGRYELRLRAEGASEATAVAEIVEGEETRLDVALPKLLPEEVRKLRAARARAARASQSSRANWFLGGGIAAGVLGGGALVFAQVQGNSAVQGARSAERLDDTVSQYQAVGVGGASVMAVGVGLLVTAIWQYATLPDAPN